MTTLIAITRDAVVRQRRRFSFRTYLFDRASWRPRMKQSRIVVEI